jgi:hypothetical protein
VRRLSSIYNRERVSIGIESGKRAANMVKTKGLTKSASYFKDLAIFGGTPLQGRKQTLARPSPVLWFKQINDPL